MSYVEVVCSRCACWMYCTGDFANNHIDRHIFCSERCWRLSTSVQQDEAFTELRLSV